MFEIRPRHTVAVEVVAFNQQVARHQAIVIVGQGEQSQARIVEVAVLDGDVAGSLDPDRGRECAVGLCFPGVISEGVALIAVADVQARNVDVTRYIAGSSTL